MGKASKRSWFSKLTDAQLVELAESVGIDIAGCAAAPRTRWRAALVARLHANVLATPYGLTYLSPTNFGSWWELETDRDGISMDDIKQQCRERKLSPTGNRFKLVLALLQHDGAGARAAAATAAQAAAVAEKRVEREKKRLRVA
jgi:hypothetical protein